MRGWRIDGAEEESDAGKPMLGKADEFGDGDLDAGDVRTCCVLSLALSHSSERASERAAEGPTESASERAIPSHTPPAPCFGGGRTVLLCEAGFPPVEERLDGVPLLRAADLRPHQDESAQRAAAAYGAGLRTSMMASHTSSNSRKKLCRSSESSAGHAATNGPVTA